jgi:Flp pilus assembly pilin Flp
MKKLKKFSKRMLKDQRGQGTAEYVLLIAIVVGALVVFGPGLKSKLTGKWQEISGQMDEVTK